MEAGVAREPQCGRTVSRPPLTKSGRRSSYRMPPSSARMRSSVGGWLLKSDISPPPVNGLMMNMCAVAGLASSGTRFDDRVDLPQRVGQPVRVARDLRAAGVGRELARSRDRHLDQHRGDRRQDDRRQQRDRIVAAIAAVVAAAVAAEHRRQLRRVRAANMIAAAIVAATELMRMSRCFTCASSCAMTPSSSWSLRICRIPSVAATAACEGFRPVANAFGDGSGMM